MQFEIEHILPCSAEKAWSVFFDEAFEKALSDEQPHLNRTIIRDEKSGPLHIREIQVAVQRELPSLLTKLVGEDIGYTQEERIEHQRLVMEWTVRSEKLGERFGASGEYKMSDIEGGCRRIIKGEVSFDFPMVGGRIEKMIASELQAAYDRTAELAIRWLEEGRS